MSDQNTATATHPKERRIHSRVALKTEVTWNSESNFYTGFTNDVSSGGIFVATHNIMPRGTVLDLEFSIPDGEGPIRASGEVRWVREYYQYSDSDPGMGVQFVDLAPEDQARIQAFVRRRETIFFDDE